jgi:hypothetical protein
MANFTEQLWERECAVREEVELQAAKRFGVKSDAGVDPWWLPTERRNNVV